MVYVGRPRAWGPSFPCARLLEPAGFQGNGLEPDAGSTFERSAGFFCGNIRVSGADFLLATETHLTPGSSSQCRRQASKRKARKSCGSPLPSRKKNGPASKHRCGTPVCGQTMGCEPHCLTQKRSKIQTSRSGGLVPTTRKVGFPALEDVGPNPLT